jgi:hypothetical protein
VFQVVYDGVNVKYYANGTLHRTTARSLGSNLYLDSSLYNINNSGVKNVVFGPIAVTSGVALQVQQF